MPEAVIFADGKRVALASSAKQDALEDAARIGDVIDTETSSDDAKEQAAPRHLPGDFPCNPGAVHALMLQRSVNHLQIGICAYTIKRVLLLIKS